MQNYKTAEGRREIVMSAFPTANSFRDFDRSLSFEVEHYAITFEKLEQLSQGLKTKQINFDSGIWSSGCDTCGHGSSKPVEINVSNIGSL